MRSRVTHTRSFSHYNTYGACFERADNRPSGPMVLAPTPFQAHMLVGDTKLSVSPLANTSCVEPPGEPKNVGGAKKGV